MNTLRRVVDYTASGTRLDSTEMPIMLICLQRALLLAEVPGVRCTNEFNGEQKFEIADGTPLALYFNQLKEKARKGEAIPTPREVLTLFGLPCFSALPCGAPAPICTGGSSIPATPFNPEKE